MQAVLDLDAPLVFPPAQATLNDGQQTPPLAPLGGDAYSPNSNPFAKRPATRTPAGSSIAAWRRVSGGSNSDMPEVPDFGSSPASGSEWSTCTPVAPLVEMLPGRPFPEDDGDEGYWLTSPEVAFDEVASTWQAVDQLSDLYDEALASSIEKAKGKAGLAILPRLQTPSPESVDCKGQKPEVMNGLMTVSEEEELEDTAPLGRLPLAHFDMGESDTNTDADLSADDVMSLSSPRSTSESMDAAEEEGGLNGTSTPRRRVGLASLVGHPSPAEQHPRSYCLLSSDITSMGSLEPQDNAAGAAHQQLLQDGASLHASLEAVAQQIRSISGLPTAVSLPAVDTKAEDLSESPIPELAPESAAFSSPISTTTSKGASPPPSSSPDETLAPTLLAGPDTPNGFEPLQVQYLDGKRGAAIMLALSIKTVPPNVKVSPTSKPPLSRASWASTAQAFLYYTLLITLMSASVGSYLHYMPNAYAKAPSAGKSGGLRGPPAGAVFTASLGQTYREVLPRLQAALPDIDVAPMLAFLEGAKTTGTEMTAQLATTLKGLHLPATLKQFLPMASSPAKPVAEHKAAPAPGAEVAAPTKNPANLPPGSEGGEKLKVSSPGEGTGPSAWAGHVMQALTGPPTTAIPAALSTIIPRPTPTAIVTRTPAAPPTPSTSTAAKAPKVASVAAPSSAATIVPKLKPKIEVISAEAVARKIPVSAQAAPQHMVTAPKARAPPTMAYPPMAPALAAAAVLLLLSIAAALGILLWSASGRPLLVRPAKVDMEDDILLTYEEDALLEDYVMVPEAMVAVAEVEQGIASPAVSSASPSPAHSRQYSEAPSARITRSRSRQPSLAAVAMAVSAAASLVAVDEEELQEGGAAASEGNTRMSPAASITRSLRSISRAVTATVSGARRTVLPDDGEVVSRPTPATSSRSTGRHISVLPTDSTAEPSLRTTRARRAR